MPTEPKNGIFLGPTLEQLTGPWLVKILPFSDIHENVYMKKRHLFVRLIDSTFYIYIT